VRSRAELLSAGGVDWVVPLGDVPNASVAAHAQSPRS
jgi:hypothetical protein